MFSLRKLLRARGTAYRATASQRAAGRCDTAEKTLADAQLGGDPQKITASCDDLDQAVTAAGNALLAWERTCQVLRAEVQAEAGHPPDRRWPG